MKALRQTYNFAGEVWLYPGTVGNWHFVSLPKTESLKIKEAFGRRSPGWRSLPVLVRIGKTNWKTSIFPDRKEGVYLLPLKASVRRDEQVNAGDTIAIKITIAL